MSGFFVFEVWVFDTPHGVVENKNREDEKEIVKLNVDLSKCKLCCMGMQTSCTCSCFPSQPIWEMRHSFGHHFGGPSVSLS